MQTDNPPLIHCLLSVCAICIREMKWLLYDWEQYVGIICLYWCVSERKEESDCRGRLSCRLRGQALLKYLEVKGQQMIWWVKSQTAEGKPFDIRSYGEGKAADITFYVWNWQNYHSPSWFPLMLSAILSCVSVCLSLWVNNKQPPSRQAVKQANLLRAGRGTFRDFHQITLSSFHCVCWPPPWYFSPPHAANWNHLVFR